MANNPDKRNENGFTELVKILVSVIEERDPFIKGHADRVAPNCVLFARRLGLSKLEINQLYLAGLLHDIGKVLLLKVLREITPTTSMSDVIENAQVIPKSFGGTILRKWGFTENFVRIALLHQGPRLSGSTAKEVLIVNLANAISKKVGDKLYDQEDTGSLGIEAMTLLGLSPDSVDQIKKETDNLMKETGSIF